MSENVYESGPLFSEKLVCPFCGKSSNRFRTYLDRKSHVMRYHKITNQTELIGLLSHSIWKWEE
jgi:hypothetical protein